MVISRQNNLFNDIVVDRLIFENYQITLFSCFTFKHKVSDYLKQGFIFTVMRSETFRLRNTTRILLKKNLVIVRVIQL